MSRAASRRADIVTVEKHALSAVGTSMKVLIEFYRVRDCDDAHAVLGRVTCDAIGSEAALKMARALFRTIDMPQMPDAFRVCDVEGNELFQETIN
jgi:hypothetical protein